MKPLSILTLVVSLYAVAQNVEAADLILPPPPSKAIIVDDSSPGFSASTNWIEVASTSAYGGGYHFRVTGPYADPATWAGQLPASGQYSAYATWVAGANRSASAPYIITHASGSTTVFVNQQVNGGTWKLLGTFNFNAGTNTIKLSPWTSTGAIVVADAVKWQQ